MLVFLLQENTRSASLVFTVPRMDRAAVPSECAVCFRDGHNRRVLKCLHSFCASCIDQLVLSKAAAEGHEHEVACPLCRTRTRLPKNGSGASGLPKDRTKRVVEELQCETCKGKGESEKPGVWCVKCKCALCFKHVGEHMSSGLGPSSHLVGDLPKLGASMACEDSPSLCEEHNEPLKYFCSSCDVPVCGGCAAVGRHRGHQPVVTMKEVTAKLKKKVQTKADHLESDVLPRVEKTISRIDYVSTELTAGADNVRADIRAAADGAVNTIRACEQQKLQEVDDIEQTRHKALDRQKDDLQRHAEAMKTAIGFWKKLEQSDCGESAGNLLDALDKRTTSLASVDFSESPLHHSDISFETVGEADLIAKAGDLVGVVSPCEASAATSILEGSFKKTVQKGSPAMFTVIAKDRRGKTMTRGGDTIHATWTHKPAEVTIRPMVEVKDNGNGRYDITCRPSCDGEYTVEVSVNGTKLPHALSITCEDRWFNFDSAWCQDKNMISSDKMTVTHFGQVRYSSVLGSQGVQQGQHSWRVQVDRSNSREVFVGVAEKDKLKDTSNYNQSYSWYGNSGQKCVMGQWSSSISAFQVGDILRLDLNCDEHTLRITNQRSGETAMIDNLPASELFPYFTTYHNNDSFSLVW